MSYTDPSGHFIPLVAGGIAALAGATAVEIAVVVGVAAFGQTLAMGGSFGDALKSGIISGVSAYAFASVGTGFDFSSAGFGDIAMLGLKFGAIGGITSVLQGGKFGHGFVTAGIGGLVGGSLGVGGTSGQIAGRTLAKMVVGGTLSRATGGKFVNGAALAGFSAAIGETAYANRPKQIKLLSPNIRVRIGVSPEHAAQMSDIAFVDEVQIATETASVGTPPPVSTKVSPTSIASTTAAPPASLDGEHLMSRYMGGQAAADLRIAAEQRAGTMAGQWAGALQGHQDLQNAALIAVGAPVIVGGGASVAGYAGVVSTTGTMVGDMALRNHLGQSLSAGSTLLNGSVSLGFGAASMRLTTLSGPSSSFAWGWRTEAGSFATGNGLVGAAGF